MMRPVAKKKLVRRARMSSFGGRTTRRRVIGRPRKGSKVVTMEA